MHFRVAAGVRPQVVGLASVWLAERLSVLTFGLAGERNRLRMDSAPDVPSFA